MHYSGQKSVRKYDIFVYLFSLERADEELNYLLVDTAEKPVGRFTCGGEDAKGTK